MAKNDAFLEAFSQILVWEGYESDDPDDPGGYTIYGISEKSYPDVAKRIREADPPTRIRLAEEFYREEIWVRNRLDEYRNIDIAIKIFDMIVNMGPLGAGMVVQKSINDLGGDLVVDGIIGRKTREAVNSFAPAEILLKTIVAHRVLYYVSLARNSGPMKKYLKGWIGRA